MLRQQELETASLPDTGFQCIVACGTVGFLAVNVQADALHRAGAGLGRI